MSSDRPTSSSWPAAPSRAERPSGPPGEAPHANYLLFSDVHLGADLVQHARPWTIERLRRVLQIDRDLSTMLDHYRENADPERPWRLVIAGDLVDFMGMSIAPMEGTQLDTPMIAEEHSHGLGSARDHAMHKMRAVAARHDLVFRKLADFVAAGHSVVLVRGNHDVDFYWETARAAFVEALVERAGDSYKTAEGRAQLEGRVEFRHWFYYVEGLLYVEHGHQYDETCSHPFLLAPLQPGDPSRIAYSFSDILLRFVVRPTRGLSTEGHDERTMLDYIRMAFSLGIGGAAGLGYRYGRAIVAMFAAWRDHVSEQAHKVRAEHDSHLERIAERVRLSADKLRALGALAATPVTVRPFAILRTLFVDLAASSALLVVLSALLIGFGLMPLHYVALLIGSLATGIVIWHKSPRVIDPGNALKQGAARVAQLLPARFVVMGHTHAPMMESIAQGVTYVNLGGWAVDDLDELTPEERASPPPSARRAPCTHLVIRHVDGVAQAELRRWDSREGASVMAASDGAASGVHERPPARSTDAVA